MTILVSIILPIYNEKQSYLRSCLDSILNQSFLNWECLCIVESKDLDNVKLVSEYVNLDNRFKLIKPAKRIGLPASLNLGISLSKAELISRIDSDDIMYRSRLEIQYKYMHDHPNVSVIGTAYNKLDENGLIVGIRRYPQQGWLLFLYFLIRCGLAHPTVMLRKKEFQNLGGYNESLKYCEDLDLWLRYKSVGARLANIPIPLTAYRVSKRKYQHWAYMMLVRFQSFFKYRL